MTLRQQTPAEASPAPASTPAEARKLADRMMQIMSSLLAIVERETELVRNGEVREAMNLETEKGNASRQYAASVKQLQASRDYLARTTPELLSALQHHHELFRSMLQVNLTVLATAHAVSEGIVRGVNNELQRRNLPNGYTAAGHRATPGPRHATPLSVSRSL